MRMLFVFRTELIVIHFLHRFFYGVEFVVSGLTYANPASHFPERSYGIYVAYSNVYKSLLLLDI